MKSNIIAVDFKRKCREKTSEDYDYQELWQITAGFQDPSPPTIEQIEAFYREEIEL
jgi:hypothetical protein